MSLKCLRGRASQSCTPLYYFHSHSHIPPKNACALISLLPYYYSPHLTHALSLTHTTDVPPKCLRGRHSVHLDPARTWRGQVGLREGERTLAAHSHRRIHPSFRHFDAFFTQRR